MVHSPMMYACIGFCYLLLFSGSKELEPPQQGLTKKEKKKKKMGNHLEKTNK